MKGLYTAIITPFNRDGQIDEEGLRQNLRYQLTNDVDGIVVLGATGEAATIDDIERTRLIEITVEEAGGKIKIFVGAGTNSTASTIEATRQAKTIGADGALIVTPYFNKPTQEGIFRHFSAIVDAVEDFPICIYNTKGRTGQNIETETIQRLTQHPEIIAVKEASGNISQMSDVINATHDQPQVYILSGDDELTLPLMALGGHGVISVASNLLPKEMKQLVKAAEEGDFALAREWHRKLLPFFKSNFIETNPIPIKAAMQACGMAAGPCRLPLCELSPKNLNEILTIVHKLPCYTTI